MKKDGTVHAVPLFADLGRKQGRLEKKQVKTVKNAQNNCEQTIKIWKRSGLTNFVLWDTMNA